MAFLSGWQRAFAILVVFGFMVDIPPVSPGSPGCRAKKRQSMELVEAVIP